MATTTEVSKAVRAITDEIDAVRKRFDTAKSSILGGSTALGNVPTKYSDELNTIDGYGTTDAFEAVKKAEKTKLVTEYLALKSEIDTLIANF